MKFIADENFPGPRIKLLKEEGVDIKSIAELYQGASDEQVIKLASEDNRIILTHDSDYGELIFKIGFRPEPGVAYFKLYDFEPSDPGKILLDLIEKEIDFTDNLTVVKAHSIRQRSFNRGTE